MSADLSVYASAGRVANPVDRERVARIGAALARAEPGPNPEYRPPRHTR